MGKIMTRCPQTGQDYATGMEMEAERFQRMPVFFARARCPHCRVEHEWFAAHAWVQGARPRESEEAVELV